MVLRVLYRGLCRFLSLSVLADVVVVGAGGLLLLLSVVFVLSGVAGGAAFVVVVVCEDIVEIGADGLTVVVVGTVLAVADATGWSKTDRSGDTVIGGRAVGLLSILRLCAVAAGWSKIERSGESLITSL